LFFDRVTDSVDKRNTAEVIFLEFTTASDTVSHEILIENLIQADLERTSAQPWN